MQATRTMQAIGTPNDGRTQSGRIPSYAARKAMATCPASFGATPMCWTSSSNPRAKAATATRITGLYQLAIAPVCSAGWTASTNAANSAIPPVTGVIVRCQRSGIGIALGPGSRRASHEKTTASPTASVNVPTDVTRWSLP